MAIIQMTRPPQQSSHLPPFSPRMFGFFAWYGRRYLRKHFHAVRMARDTAPSIRPGTPVVVYLNHPSWWDPMLGVLAADLWFRDRRHAAPIDVEALPKYRILEKLGFFGVEQNGGRGAARFLRAAEAILENDGVLWITGEGGFTDARKRPVELRPGLAHLARRMERGVLLPMAVEYTFWRERSPEALFRMGRPLDVQDITLGVDGWQRLLEDELAQEMDALARDSIGRNDDAFETLIDGETGVGGVYDLWRRLRAIAKGEKFKGAHEIG